VRPRRNFQRLPKPDRRRGLFRLWIVGPALFVIAVASTDRAGGEPPPPPPYLPLVEFDHPFDGIVEANTGKSAAEMRKICGYERALGCAWTYTYTYTYNWPARPPLCVIYLADDEIVRAAGYDPEMNRRHEIGHCNGWPATHPGERYEAKAGED
jgi:hypothetical protein